MDRDIRSTAIFQEAHRLWEAAYKPGEGYVSDIADLHRSPDPARLLFTGTVVDGGGETSTTRICEIELESGSIQFLTSGPNSDRHARTSPDGRTIAFLSDRDRLADFQLFLLDTLTQTLSPGPRVDGWVEYLEWSPDGRRILLGVAGHGAELSSGQGAYATVELPADEPSWMPRVTGTSSEALWRRAWIFEASTGELWCASGDSENVWEATWCGNGKLAIVSSHEPHEGAWYTAGLSLIDLSTRATERLYTPSSQIALPRGSPTGRYLAVIEAISSDREYVAGDLHLFDLKDGTARSPNTNGVDVTYIEWTSDRDLLLAGHRGLSTVVASVTADSLAGKDLWEGTDTTTSNRYASVIALQQPDAFAFVCESFFTRPQAATVVGGTFQIARAGEAESGWATDGGRAEEVRWQAPDGLEIQGWLLRPKGEPPYATITDVHGGPVLHWRPYWLGRARYAELLLRHGYALFLPNPRGSSGRGQDYASRVVGDIGGADTADLLSGIDHLISQGIADPDRLGITGLSYGGFMSCWLPTQDSRFGAAVAVGPATNHVSHHLTCNIPQFVSLFVKDDYADLSGRYYSRSPVLQARNSITPTLLVCGDLDRCTPSDEGLQFHNALTEIGVDSCLLRYPQEGHGVRGNAAATDFAARCVMWFERYIPAHR